MGIDPVKYLLDTHIWIWWHANPKKLSTRVRNIIIDPRRYDELLLSAISPWEFFKLLEKERLAISCDPLQWVNQALDMSGLRLVPLTPRIAWKSTVLPQPFHTDPADQIIAATSREENAVVLTQDKRLLSYKHIKTIG